MNFSIETDFPGGNACNVSMEVFGDTTRIAFAPDPRGSPETLWFHFKVRRTAPGAPGAIKLLLKHSANMLGGDQPQNFRPAIRYAQSDWQRLPAPDIEETLDGRFLVRWTVAAPETVVEVAVCYPYGQVEVESLLRETDGVWQCDEIGVGQRCTPLLRLANDYGRLGNERPGLYLIARQHAGETSGSWVLDGFLRRLAEVGESAPLAWVVPLADADGVRFGDYSKDQFPYDMNRAWGQPPMRHETLAMHRDVNCWSQRCRPALAMDFHAPGACEDSGIYCFLPLGEESFERFPLLHDCIESIKDALTPRFASENFALVWKHRSRWEETPTFSQFMAAEHDVPCVMFEVPYALCGERTLTREDYREAGARICDAVLKSDFLK